jgi:hypothetical protein
MDEFGLSQIIISELQSRRNILEIPASKSQAIATFEDPYALLTALGHYRPGNFDLIILDFPRASKRLKVALPTLDQSGNLKWSDVGHEDPDYLFRLKSNVLAITRLAVKTLSSQGLLLAIATPDTYIPVRTSIEQFLGHEGFLGELVYQTRTGGANDSKYMDVGHETLLVFAIDPSRISGFQMKKDPEELNKYSQEDVNGRYYWDTYIRKQARNYYKIKCPDGSLLEKDEFGNRISWLWKEQTFLKKLDDGEVKFEKQDGKWRIYYKDRLKELKILRSLVLNKTELSEISEDATSGATGAGLLTQRGSAEIKTFAGLKPEYLKSSEYFKFILEVFGRGKRVLVPFSDYGAALFANFSNSKLASELLVNNRPEHEKLVKWRINMISGLSSESYEIASQLKTFDVTSLGCDDLRIAAFMQNFISNFDRQISEWYEVFTDTYKIQVSEGSSLHILIETVERMSHTVPTNLLSELSHLEFNTDLPATVWTTLNEDVVRATFPDLIEFRIMNFPLFML